VVGDGGVPRVTVILTSYNKPPMLVEAIDSVLAQTYRGFELLVLDDNSAGSAVAEVLGCYWNIPELIVYKSNVQPEERLQRVRYAVLANLGLQLARGEYITYLCDDDLYLPHRLERMVARLDEGDCQVVYGAQQMVREGQPAGVREIDGVLHDAACRVDHSSVMHTAEAARHVGGWDELTDWRTADATFWSRLNQAGYPFHPISEVLDVHRYHQGSLSARLDRGLPPG
jgi:spore maturation protein CgeD